MLRRAENASLHPQVYGWRSHKFRVTLIVGRSSYVLNVTQEAYSQLEYAQQTTPMFIIRIGERNYWRFRGKFYWENENLPPEHVHALLFDRERKTQRRVSRALSAMSQPQQAAPQRQPIPDDVKMFVWQRDNGRCVTCGSNQSLEFDHIIPVIQGGGSTARNIQLLCESCNRSKGGHLI